MTFRPPETLAGRLREQAAREQVSVQVLLERMVEEYLHRRDKKAMISREVTAVKANFADALRRLGEGA